MRREGYTLIEVMTAVVVMTIGATGLVAMQGASVRANQDANETTTALNFATTWIERIKRDARRWNTGGNADLANTSYLTNLTSNAGTWVVPADVAPDYATADYQGFDTAGDSNTALPAITSATDPSPAHFCANVQFTLVHAWGQLTQTTVATQDADAIRADVRVWWYRSAADTNRSATCRGGALTAAQLASPQIRKLYLSTVVRYKELGWP